MKRLLLIGLLLAGCGGGGDSPQTSSNSTVDVTSCGDFTIPAADVNDIVEAAQSSGAEVVDAVVDEPATVDQTGALRVTGAVVIGCGNTIVANEDNDTVTQAARLKQAILAGNVASIEVK